MPNFETAIDEVTRILIYCLDIYFGLRSNQVSENLIIKVQKEIFSKYKHLSLEDLEYSFERFNIPEKTSWNNITIQEIMAPIIRYSNIKHRINNERIKIEAEKNELEKRNKESEVFYNNAIETYLKSLENGSWIGDMFQAKVLLNKFTKYFTQDMRAEYKKQSKIEEMRIVESGRIDAYLYTNERILAEMVIKDCVKNGYTL